MEAKAYFDGSFLEEFCKEYLEYIKNNVDLNYQEMLQIFGKMQAIYLVFDVFCDRVKIPDDLVVRNQMVEEKMYSQAETYLIEQDLFVEWLLKEVTKIADHHEEIGYIKENYEETIQSKFLVEVNHRLSKVISAIR